MFGIALVAWISDKMKKSSDKKDHKPSKRLEDVTLPGFLRIFNENMVATAILMFCFSELSWLS